MITTGLVSITFRALTPEAIIPLVVRAGQQAIEWGGDIHVPHGDIARAQSVGEATRAAGLELAAYGSYYRLGHSEAEGLHFASVCATAQALGCPAIRVWAGKRPLAEVDAVYRQEVTADARRIAGLAADAGLDLVFEFHGRTLTESLTSAQQLLNDVPDDNVYTLWQPRNGIEPEINRNELKELLPRLYYAHVFHWWPTSKERRPLAEGAVAWGPYLDLLRQAPRPMRAMMEYVRDHDPENYLRDAATLEKWVRPPAR